MPSKPALVRFFLLGAVSGLRSLTAPALLSRQIAHHNPQALRQTPLAPLANETTAKVLGALAAGEIVADKLPGIPARIKPGPLVARALSGALAGAAVCAEEQESLASGAAVGALAAVAAAFGAYYLRQYLDNQVGLPDTAVALAEDACAYTLSRQALR